MKNMINNELYYSFKLILNLTFYSEELLKWIFKILAGLFNTHSVKGFTSDPVSLKNSQKYWVGDSDYSPLPSNPLWKKKFLSIVLYNLFSDRGDTFNTEKWY